MPGLMLKAEGAGRDRVPNYGAGCLAVGLLLAICGCTGSHAGSANQPASAEQAEPEASPADLKPAAETYRDGKILLGSPRLTAGIPGKGPLTLKQLRAWLDDPANHEPLEVALPLGLSEAQDQVKIPADNRLTRAKIELGRQLFFDRRLASPDRTFSCSHCHHPGDHFSQSGHGRDPSVKFARTVPANVNRIITTRQFWDGHADTLEAQVVFPIESPSEMGNTREACLETLGQIEGYRLQFQKIFGGLSIEGVEKALASFERVLVTGPSPIDYWQTLNRLKEHTKEELTPQELADWDEAKRAFAENPLSDSARRGLELFRSARTNCNECHTGPNFTDEEFHNIGIGLDQEDPDLGRFRVTHEKQDWGAFKTPTLRNIAQTAPYMHRGQLPTLEAVVDWFDRPPQGIENLDSKLRPLNLTDQEKADLVEFLRALTGPTPPIETGRMLP